MSNDVNTVLERWRAMLFEPRRGLAWVVRDVVTTAWPPCPRCRWVGETLWDLVTNAPSQGCVVCEGTGVAMDPVLRDYLAQHGARWIWGRSQWLDRLRAAFEPMPLPGGLGDAWVSPQGQVLWLHEGEARDVELTIDRRGGAMVREPDLVVRWWPPYRALLVTPPDEERVAPHLGLLRQVNEAVFDQLRCGLAHGDERAQELAERL